MQHCLLQVVLLLVHSCVMSKKFGFISIVCLSKLHSIKPHLGYCQVKSSQVYFFNSRIKCTAKLHNTKLYSEIYIVTHNKFIQ